MLSRNWAVSALILAAVGCADMWGIQDAKVDPTFNGVGSEGPLINAGSGSNPAGGESSGGHQANPQGGFSGSVETGGGAGIGIGSPASGGVGIASGAAPSTGGATMGTGGTTMGSAGHDGHTGGIPTGGTPGSGGSGTGGTGGGAPASSPQCQEYCSTVMSSCTDTLALYQTQEVCLAVCRHLPLGTADQTIGNSIGCRLHAAQSSAMEPTDSCPVLGAGPGGNNICGSNCEAVCMIAQTVCTGANQQWPNALACLTECQSLEDLKKYSKLNTSGAHVQCRLYHVSAAAAGRPEFHCPHVGGGIPCVAPPPAVP